MKNKGKILILFPYPFTEFNYYKFEILKLKKKYGDNVIIHDLSNVVNKKRFNKEWKTRIEKKSIKFTSLISWALKFHQIKKKKILVFNFVKTLNFNSCIINIIVRLSKKPMVFYIPVDLFSFVKPYKKNLSFFFSRISQHKLNLRVYLFAVQRIFFNLFLKFVSTSNVIILSNNFEKLVFDNYEGLNMKKIKKIDFNSYDYSNAITYTQKKILKKKKYIIYIDNGAPYFSGDAHLKGDLSFEGDLKKQYSDLNIFFNKIEKFFSAKIIIIPHPKYKSPSKKVKSLNPFFNNREVDNDYNSLAKLSRGCLFFINKMSTAISYPISFNKPVIHIYSSEYNHPREEFQSILDLCDSVGHKPIDICNFTKKEILNSLKINKNKYKKFKYDFLTPKNKSVSNVPNYKILNKLIKNFL